MAEGAEIVWVLEELTFGNPGTAEQCMEFLDDFGDPSVGWCVGDGQTRPTESAFDDSPFSIGRGFDIIVPRSTMSIEYTTSHGTVDGNENISGKEVLEEVRRVVGELR